MGQLSISINSQKFSKSINPKKKFKTFRTQKIEDDCIWLIYSKFQNLRVFFRQCCQLVFRIAKVNLLRTILPTAQNFWGKLPFFLHWYIPTCQSQDFDRHFDY